MEHDEAGRRPGPMASIGCDMDSPRRALADGDPPHRRVDMLLDGDIGDPMIFQRGRRAATAGRAVLRDQRLASCLRHELHGTSQLLPSGALGGTSSLRMDASTPSRCVCPTTGRTASFRCSRLVARNGVSFTVHRDPELHRISCHSQGLVQSVAV